MLNFRIFSPKSLPIILSVIILGVFDPSRVQPPTHDAAFGTCWLTAAVKH